MNVTRAYRIGWKDFLEQTTPDDRAYLRDLLNDALTYFLNRDQPIFLEQFGIVFPKKREIHTTEVLQKQAYIGKKQIRSIGFEKCIDLVEYHRKRFHNVVESHDLAKRIFAQLSLSKQEYWGPKKVAAYLRTLLQAIRNEVIIDGSSRQLLSLGTFYSLHNRQGTELNDWFAGSDIFLIPNYTDVLQADQPKAYPRPVLQSALEPFEALFGKPHRRISIKIKKELEHLGYDVTSFDTDVEDEQKQLAVSIYKNQKDRSYVVCSEGLRTFSVSSEKKDNTQSNEAVFQISKRSVKSDAELVDILRRVYTLCWILIKGRPSQTLKTGLALSGNHPLLRTTQTKLKGIFITSYTPIRHPQLAENKEFTYMNIVGITAEEMKVAELYSPTHLDELLRFRRYDQITNLHRASVTNRTGLLTTPRKKNSSLHLNERAHRVQNIV